MNKNTVYIVIAALVAMLGGFSFHYLSNKAADNRESTQAMIEFNLPDLTGQQHNSKEWQGKLLIINFWATWCAPCLKEIPEFIKLQDEFNDDDVQFIGIAVDESEAVKEYLETIKINYPILIGGNEAIALSHQLGNIINAVPFTIFINQQGQIIHRQPGEINREKVIEIITPFL